MSEPTYRGQQIAIHMVFGFIPVLKVRKSVPSQYSGWEWSRWRLARVSEVIAINSGLRNMWRD